MPSFLEELKRRNVVRVGLAYLVMAWLVLQMGEVVFDLLEVPKWAGKLLIAFLLLGLPIALFFAWAFELTPDGIKREKDVDRNESITRTTGRKLDYTIIAVLVVAVGFLVVHNYVLDADMPGPLPLEESLKSIAVLPFENRSAESDTQYFADGIHDDLLTQLARIGDLKVISRTSVLETRRRICGRSGRSSVLRHYWKAQCSEQEIACALMRSSSTLQRMIICGQRPSTRS